MDGIFVYLRIITILYYKYFRQWNEQIDKRCLFDIFFIQRHGERLYIFTYMRFLREEFIMNSFLDVIEDIMYI